MTPMELFLLINHDRKYLYYDVYDLCFTDSAINRREFENYLLLRKKEWRRNTQNQVLCFQLSKK